MQKANKEILQIAEYWLCKAKIAQDSGDHDRVVCLYQQGIAFNAEVPFLECSLRETNSTNYYQIVLIRQ